MCLEPVVARTGLGYKGHGAVIGVGHTPLDQLAHLVELGGDDVEYQFVVHLHYHARAQSAPLHLGEYPHHGHLDDVCGSALDGGIDGIALGIRPHGRAARRDVGQIAATPHAGQGIPLLAGLDNRPVQILAYVGIGGEISVYQLLGLGTGYAETLAQPEGRDTVDDAEIGRLGVAALVVCDLGERHAIYLRGRDAVDVVAAQETLDHILVTAQVGDEAQLYLRVVGAHDHVARVGYERAAYLASVVGAHGDILQVGIGRRDAPGGGDGLVV